MARGGRRLGAGRKPGSKNKVTISIATAVGDPSGSLEQIAKSYTAEALRTLAVVMGSAKASSSARVTAAIALLDRGHGKPKQALEHSGPNGGPIEHSDVSDLEIARRLAFILESAARKRGQ